MKNSYRKQLFYNFFILFFLFILSVIIFQYQREVQSKRESLENTLDNYASIIDNVIQKRWDEKKDRIDPLKQFLDLIPDKELRVTVIDDHGHVRFDNRYNDFFEMDNHKDRPEVLAALKRGKGSSIRFSNSLNKEFYYYARSFPNYIVRAALPYDTTTINILKVDNLFFYSMSSLFVVVLFLLYFLTGQMGASVSRLRNFAVVASSNRSIAGLDMDFPSSELGDISKKIVEMYSTIQHHNEKLETEKKKLYDHLHVLQSGLAVFSSDKSEILSNSLFLMFASTMSSRSIRKSEDFFKIEEVRPIIDFIEGKQNGASISEFSKEKLQVSKFGKIFNIQAIVFSDNSFEITIQDVSEQEQARKLKREITGNLAHELKTPVTTVQGYLETILENQDMDTKQLFFFLDRAFKQTQRLGELISDISLLSKIEEAEHLYQKEELYPYEIVHRVLHDLDYNIKEKEKEVSLRIDSEVKFKGNQGLVYAIFRNLVENAIKYGGEKISIQLIKETDDDILFRLYDNGSGVEESHLARLFERFYRVDEGRNRRIGGTGLGLAIVKNAVLMHKGTIAVKNRNNGGLEFLFSFKKS
ncbi:hypothetical protein K5X82_15610 [Halosquirtibacter xylanolyticus]|uniref:sensor histidine kinase n=1 Tax=Halosquirtibacter xylanolyticus TaxID=3374599 RepID=UPI003747BF7A|nr:hypothetical protein K5X82_15610 [Prolixibacteraceae bacterium]